LLPGKFARFESIVFWQKHQVQPLASSKLERVPSNASYSCHVGCCCIKSAHTSSCDMSIPNSFSQLKLVTKPTKLVCSINEGQKCYKEKANSEKEFILGLKKGRKDAKGSNESQPLCHGS
jgi:hypothetical protein